MEHIRSLLKSSTPVKWLFYGDSITHGALHTFGQRDYTELFSERIRYELGRGMDVVINTAISGHTTRELLQGFEWRVEQFRPHVVFLMIGMNDCSEGNDITFREFENNLNELADRTEAMHTRLVVQTTCPVISGKAPDRERHIEEYMSAIRQVASQRGLPLVDHTSFWLEHAGQHFYWMSDPFHPNELGHRAFALLLFQALGIYDPHSYVCRLFIP